MKFAAFASASALFGEDHVRAGTLEAREGLEGDLDAHSWRSKQRVLPATLGVGRGSRVGHILSFC